MPAIPMYERERDIVIGMYHDPVEFIPRHMERWLERRELERSLLPPGFYKIKIKVIQREISCGKKISWKISQKIVFVSFLAHS